MAADYGITETRRAVRAHLEAKCPDLLITNAAVTLFIMNAATEAMARDLTVGGAK